MDFMKSGMLIKVLRVLGWLIIIAGVIVGIWASYQLGQQVIRTEWGRFGPSAGEIFMAFLVPSLIGFLSSIGSFWMAAVLENQERILEATKSGQGEIVKTLKSNHAPPIKPSEPKWETSPRPPLPVQPPKVHNNTESTNSEKASGVEGFYCKNCGKELNSGNLCSRCARNQGT